MENLSRVFQKQKIKKNMKRMCFITQFKIEFLLLFTSCRKVLGKMPGKLVCLLVSGPRLVIEQLNSLFKKSYLHDEYISESCNFNDQDHFGLALEREF